MMEERFLEIINAALENDLDPVAALQDYFHEKDSPRIRRYEIGQLVASLTDKRSTTGEKQ